MFAKVHERRRPDGSVARVIAICDEELLGRVLKEGDYCIDLKLYRSFYEGEKVTADKVKELVDRESNLNVVGKKSIAALGDAIDLSSIKTINNIPIVQIYRV